MSLKEKAKTFQQLEDEDLELYDKYYLGDRTEQEKKNLEDFEQQLLVRLEDAEKEVEWYKKQIEVFKRDLHISTESHNLDIKNFEEQKQKLQQLLNSLSFQLP